MRVEQLYPIPHKQMSTVMQAYSACTEVAWCQEEPQNQGAWYLSMHNLVAGLREGQSLYYAGRPSSASPATGHHAVHVEEQKTLVNDAVTVGAGIRQ